MNEEILKLIRLQAECRAALNSLAADAAAEVVAEKRAALEAADAALVEAIKQEETRNAESEITIDPETRERDELRANVGAGDYVRAAIAGTPLEGRAAEYAAACGCPGAMPIEIFDRDRPEVRADAHTPGPAAGTEQNTQPIGPDLFMNSLTGFLGVDMPVVGSGQAVYPIITQSGTAAPVSPGSGNDATAAVITPMSVSPKRIQGRIGYRKEDAALLGGLDAALVRDLGEVLRDSLDAQVISGSGTEPNLNGFAKQYPIGGAGSDAAATTFAVLTQRAAGMVDGIFSESFSDLRMAMSVEAYAYLASLFRSSSSEVTGLDWLSSRVSGLRANGRIKQASKTATDGACSQVFVSRRGRAIRSAVVPVWQGVTLIRDEITRSAQGEVYVNADMLVGGVTFLRSDAWAQFSIATGSK